MGNKWVPGELGAQGRSQSPEPFSVHRCSLGLLSLAPGLGVPFEGDDSLGVSAGDQSLADVPEGLLCCCWVERGEQNGQVSCPLRPPSGATERLPAHGSARHRVIPKGGGCRAGEEPGSPGRGGVLQVGRGAEPASWAETGGWRAVASAAWEGAGLTGRACSVDPGGHGQSRGQLSECLVLCKELTAVRF